MTTEAAPAPTTEFTRNNGRSRVGCALYWILSRCRYGCIVDLVELASELPWRVTESVVFCVACLVNAREMALEVDVYAGGGVAVDDMMDEGMVVCVLITARLLCTYEVEFWITVAKS